MAEIATLANRRVRLLAGFSSNSVPGVCDVELWGASPLRAARTPVSPLSDANNNAVTTVQHFYVPPGLDHLDVYGLDGACLGGSDRRDHRDRRRPRWHLPLRGRRAVPVRR